MSIVEAPVGEVAEELAEELVDPAPALSPSVAPLVQPSLDEDDADSEEAAVIDREPIVIGPTELLALSRPCSSPQANRAIVRPKGTRYI